MASQKSKPKRGSRRTMAHERGMSAWLITWEETGPAKPAREKIAAILNPRWSSERVRQIVELLHHAKQYSLSELAGYANNYAFNPYPAEYERVEGVRHTGYISCGHNPHLYARLVKDLKIQGSYGDEVVTWTEEPPKAPSWWRRRLTSA